jgi:hypothetical protein
LCVGTDVGPCVSFPPDRFKLDLSDFAKDATKFVDDD